MEKIEVEQKASAARESFMLIFTKAFENLEMDRFIEFESAFREGVLCYYPPEIYENIDIEVISELKKLDDILSHGKRSKLSKETIGVIQEISKNNTPAPSWLIEYLKLILCSNPSTKDPHRIEKIREIQESLNSLEIDIVLALSLVQEGIRRDDEDCFIESESIFNAIETIFETREELPKRYRLHFPKDPQKTLGIFRVWLVQNFSVLFHKKERFKDALDIIEESTKQKWAKSSGELDKLQTRLSILQVLDRSIKLINDESMANEERIKKTASDLENRQMVILGVFLTAAFLMPMLSGMVLHLNFEELKKIIPVIGLTAILIVNSVFIFVCREWKRMTFLFSCAAVIILLILIIQ